MIASIILSTIAAVAAILAPLLTAIINNRYSLRLKKLETFYDHKFSIYKNFFEAYGKVQNYVSQQDNHDFFAALYEVCLICNSKTRSKLFELKKCFLSGNGVANPETDKIFEECCDLLNKELTSEIQSKNHKR